MKTQKLFTLQYSNGTFYFSTPQSPAEWQPVLRDNVILLPTHSLREESNERYTMTKKMTNELTNRSTSGRVFFVSRYDTHLPSVALCEQCKIYRNHGMPNDLFSRISKLRASAVFIFIPLTV